jgi:tRNA(adenine34) deaminase
LKNKSNSSLAHAEILAINKASKKIQNWRLNDCDIYVTLEPCPMCASAIKQSRIKNIYYGVETTNMNNHKIFEMICENKDNNSPVKYYSGLKKNECLILLSEFFTRKR